MEITKEQFEAAERFYVERANKIKKEEKMSKILNILKYFIHDKESLLKAISIIYTQICEPNDEHISSICKFYSDEISSTKEWYSNKLKDAEKLNNIGDRLIVKLNTKLGEKTSIIKDLTVQIENLHTYRETITELTAKLEEQAAIIEKCRCG